MENGLMKALVCELCGGNDFVKEGDFFVCQSCGTKYSSEDAKKMMIEGTVDVQGTVKVDNSDFVEKSLRNARRAKQKEDWEETQKYYNLVEQNDPNNIEAIFYSSFGKAKISLVESDLYKRKAAFNTLQKCVSVIDDNFDINREQENKAIIEQISKDIFEMACSTYVYNQKKNGYGIVVWSDKMETVSRCLEQLQSRSVKLSASDRQRALKRQSRTARSLADPLLYSPKTGAAFILLGKQVRLQQRLPWNKQAQKERAFTSS